MLAYIKTPRTLEDCINILEVRGMSTPDREHTMRSLARIGYYRLSAYWYPFRDFCPLPDKENELVRCDRFKDGTTFDDAINFYLFDKTLRLALLDAIERLEIALRTTLVETLVTLGPQAHRDPRSYKSRFAEADIDGNIPLNQFTEGLDSQFFRSKEEYAKHFRRRYKGKPPIWVEAGTWDWGNLTHMIANLADRHKIKIANTINPDLSMKSMASWVTSLNEVRNSCAHHSRVWNKPLINSPGVPVKGAFEELDHLRNDRGQVNDDATKRIYGALVVMIFLMKRYYPRTQWHVRLREQIRTADLPTEISHSSAGFPDGWEGQAIWN